MKEKTFNIVSFVAMVLSFTVVFLCIIGAGIVGFRSETIALLFTSLIPLGTRIYAERTLSDFREERIYYLLLAFINVLIILMVLSMVFEIVQDLV